jgi:hypothetical protein
MSVPSGSVALPFFSLFLQLVDTLAKRRDRLLEALGVEAARVDALDHLVPQILGGLDGAKLRAF